MGSRESSNFNCREARKSKSVFGGGPGLTAVTYPTTFAILPTPPSPHHPGPHPHPCPARLKARVTVRLSLPARVTARLPPPSVLIPPFSLPPPHIPARVTARLSTHWVDEFAGG